MDKIKNFLQSYWIPPILFLLGIFSYCLELVGVNGANKIYTYVLSLSFSCILLLCKDVKNIFCPFFFVPFAINSIRENGMEVGTELYGYIICIAIAVFTIIFFTVRNLIRNKKDKTFTKGKMFFPLLVADVAFCLGGVIGNFHLLTFAVIVGLSLATYFFYWTAINFTENFKHYLYYLLFVGAIYLSVKIIFNFIFDSRSIWIGAQNINVASLYVLLGIIGGFGLGYKTDKDWIYFAFSVFFTAIIVISVCRLIMLLTAITMVVLFILYMTHSKNKLKFLWIITLGVLIFCIIFIVFNEYMWENVVSIFTGKFKNMGGTKENKLLNGRDYDWFINKFRENPVFGFGFYSENLNDLPKDGTQVLLAHNTIIQWISSLGIVGSVLMLYFYFGKYSIVFKGLKFKRFAIILMIVIIELSGITDQAATMDLFIYVMTIVLVGTIEQEKLQGNK